SWDRPMLTDSGGFQVFSLGELRQIDAHGVTFRSHLDGSVHRFTPEKSIQIQHNLGADIIMCFDECPPPLEREVVRAACERTHAWARACLDEHVRSGDPHRQALFGIVQGASLKTCAPSRWKRWWRWIFLATLSAAWPSAKPNPRCC